MTIPLPIPAAPFVTRAHDTLDAAVHAHQPPVVTATVPLPPSAGDDALGGEIEKVQGAAACATVYVLPAIVSVPVRAAPMFAAT